MHHVFTVCRHSEIQGLVWIPNSLPVSLSPRTSSRPVELQWCMGDRSFALNEYQPQLLCNSFDCRITQQLLNCLPISACTKHSCSHTTPRAVCFHSLIFIYLMSLWQTVRWCPTNECGQKLKPYVLLYSEASLLHLKGIFLPYIISCVSWYDMLVDMLATTGLYIKSKKCSSKQRANSNEV